MSMSIYTIARKGAGQISTMARPRGGGWLEDEMTALRAAGVDVLVSMLTSEEAKELSLTSERAAAESAGIRWLELPTTDRGVPAVDDTRSLLDRVSLELEAGAHVAVHCRIGIGRASMVAAGMLMREGVSADDAWKLVRDARGLDVPDTQEQREWVARAAAERPSWALGKPTGSDSSVRSGTDERP